MIMTGLVNGILAQLAHYVARITALFGANRGSLTKIEYYVN